MGSIPYDKRRKTPDDYHTLAQERGFEWLGPEVNDTHQKTGWRCQCGNEWQATFQKIRSGRGCPVCGIKLNAWLRSKKPEDYHAIAKKHGLEWLGLEVSTSKKKTRWRCPKGHEFESPYDKINSGKGCMQCAIDLRATLKRIKPTAYHQLAREYNIEWLGPIVTSTMVGTRWRCEFRHEWEAPYDRIRTGAGCPHCSGNARKTADDYHKIAKIAGFTWLGPIVNNVNEKTYWRCSEGHEWETCYTVVRVSGGCPHCSGVAKKTEKDYHLLAARQGIEWLGPLVTRRPVQSGG